MWDGSVPPHHVLMLTAQLERNPRSRVFADRGGTPELQGWDQATIIAARTHNLIAGLLQGLSKDKNPDIFIDYPGAPKEQEQTRQPATLAELTEGQVNNFIYG